jgi:hypothetical protein
VARECVFAQENEQEALMRHRNVNRPLATCILSLWMLSPNSSWAHGGAALEMYVLLRFLLLAIWIGGIFYFIASGDRFHRIGWALGSFPMTILAFSASNMMIEALSASHQPGWTELMSLYAIAIASCIFLCCRWIFLGKGHRDEAP